MNTHDIELPPLPKASKMYDIPGYDEEELKAYARAAIEADRKRRQSEAEEVCAEAYQVVGSLLSDLGIFECNHAEKILDNLSQAKMVHDDVLPWPSFDRKRRGEPVAWASFADNGNIRIWTTKKGGVKRLSEQVGQTLRPLYAAPQPAESCASLMSDKTACGSENGDCDSQPAEPVKKKDWVELSLWSDEDFVQVFHECPDLADRLRRVLAEPVKVPNALPSGTNYSVEPHCNGYAIYQGRDGLHHGANLAHLTECTPEFSKRIESALNAMSEPVKSHLKVSYDDKGDCLYVVCDSNEPADAEEDDKGILYRRAISDGRLIGITIMNFMGQHPK